MFPINAVILTLVLLKFAGVPAEFAGMETLSLVKFIEIASLAPSEIPTTPPVADEGKKSEKTSLGATPVVRCKGTFTE